MQTMKLVSRNNALLKNTGSATPGTITLSVQNTTNNTTPTQMYIGQTSTLEVTLTNSTGSDISLTTASALNIYLPQYYTSTNVSGMTITSILPSGWNFSAGPDCLLLTWGSSSGTWANNDSVTFTINNVITSATSVATGMFQVNFMQTGSAPTQTLPLITAPTPSNLTLSSTLAVFLQRNEVYVSESDSPLSNDLFLTLTNTGVNPLCTAWSGTAPTVTVSFVYGQDAGSLAPSTGEGDAWDITVDVAESQSNDWVYTNPTAAPDPATPAWVLSPANANQNILGTGDAASITFNFSDIISETPVGTTLMYVQFSGFQYSSTQQYNDEVFVLEIVKQDPPKTRGLISLYSANPVITVTNPSQSIDISLHWVMFDVDSVRIIADNPVIVPKNVSYTTPPPNPTPPPIINYDKMKISLSNITESQGLNFTVQAYDAGGSFLNSLQFMVYLQCNYFVDPRDSQLYPAVLIGTRLWMAADLNYNDPSISAKTQNNALQYTQAGAVAPDNKGGWRLPNADDWNSIATTNSNTYLQYLSGGSFGFNASLYNYMNSSGVEQNSNLQDGYYWSAEVYQGIAAYFCFSNEQDASCLIGYGETVQNGLETDNYLSVRFVKDMV